MPATAPGKVVRFQNSEHKITGVNADAIPDQANRTNQKTARTWPSARATAPAPITMVVSRP